MKAFGYVSAKDVAHAVALLGEHGAKVKILAGGTDLMVELKHAVHNPEIIVDVSRLDELKDIVIADDGLHIGALVTHTEIMNSPIIRDMFPALVDAAHTIGAVQTRNLGTLGGNLVTACRRWTAVRRWSRSTRWSRSPAPRASGRCRWPSSSSARARPASSPTNCWSTSSFRRKISTSRPPS